MNKRLTLYMVILLVGTLLFFYKEEAVSFLLYNGLHLVYESKLSDTLWFFLTTSIRLFLLLGLVIFVTGVIRSYFSAEKTRKALEGKSLFLGNILGALLGVVTPFCSCSAIPLFLGFVEAGIPIGATFSFLIAAPMVNEVALIMLYSLFGWEIGTIYLVSGLLIAILAGWLIGRLGLERWLEEWVRNVRMGAGVPSDSTLSFEQRLIAGEVALKEILRKIWFWFLIGVLVGAVIHGYLPKDYLAQVMQKSTWYAVPLSVLMGIPLYTCSPGAVPVAWALIDKGVPLGTALAFMMSVIGISLPEVIILRKVLKWPFIATFILIVASGIILVGYLLNTFFIF